MHPLKFLTTTPFTRVNNHIPLTNLSAQWIPLEKFHVPMPNIILDNKVNSVDTKFQFDSLQRSFIYVATETVYHYPLPFLTEKSFKGITTKRPFILVAAPGSLALLKKLGVKTFNSFWDENYDNELDPERRLIKILNLIEDICNRDLKSLENMLLEMSPILQYNFNFYKNLFFKQELGKFKRALNYV
jgi:hypothetical protein